MNEKDELKVKIPQCGNESQEEFYHRFSEAIEAITEDVGKNLSGLIKDIKLGEPNV